VSISTDADTAEGEEPLRVAVQEALRFAEAQGFIGSQSSDRLARTLHRFAAFLAVGEGVGELDGVSQDATRSFIVAPSPNGDPPSPATMHFRRSTLRLLFRLARSLGIAHGDPTLDIILPARSSHQHRALSDEEVALCRSWALETLTETRQPAAWALAEATARTSEIGHISVPDIHFETGRVWLHGSSRVEPRWGLVSDWGRQQLARRVAVLKDASDLRLVYSGRAGPESAQASSCIAIGETLRRAGLLREPDVRPLSVAAWSGARAFKNGVMIDEVARMLGVRSLDQAARLIGWSWRSDSSRGSS
jgi:integrase